MWPRISFLQSYAYLRSDRKFEEILLSIAPYADVLLDSGAFTNRMILLGKAKGQTPFDITEYIAACRRYHGRVWQYIQLDVVKDPASSATNLSAMLDAGLRPMPVWVENADPARVPDLVALNEWICVAGGVGTPDKYVHRRYQTAFQASGNRARIHALGFLRWPDVFQLPIASGDSSALTNGSKFGWYYRFDPHVGLVNLHRSDLLNQSLKARSVREYLFRCNIDARQMSDPETAKKMGGIPSVSCVHAYCRYQSFCAARGFKLNLVITGQSWLSIVLACLVGGDDMRFDYPTVRDTYADLNATWKQSTARYLDRAKQILMEKTSWNEPPSP